MAGFATGLFFCLFSSKIFSGLFFEWYYFAGNLAMHIKAYLFFSLLVISLGASAQQLDTVEYSHELSLYTTEKLLDAFDTTLQKEDTSFYEDYAIHPLRATQSTNLDLGPVATPYYSFEERFVTQTQFDLGFHTLNAYQANPKTTKYYFSNTPRTLLKYSQGGQDLLYIKAQHSQKVSKLWSLGMDYERIKSNNVYYGNITDFTTVKIPNSFNTKLYTRFHSPNKRYQVLGNVYFDKNTINETGGITDRVHFDTLQGREKKYFNLAQNANAKNTIKNSGIYIKHYYQLGDFPEAVVTYDSLNSDSIISIDIPKGTSKGQLYHEIWYKKSHLLFEDPSPNSAYYEDFILSSTTADSVIHKSLRNTVGVMLHGKFSPNLSLTHEFNSIEQNGLMNLSFHNVSARAAAALNLASIQAKGSWLVHVLGYNAGDQHLRIKLKIKNFNIDVNASQYEPSYVSKYYLSNHFYWYNRWDKISTQEVHVNYAIGKYLDLGISNRTLTNWIVYGADARPSQVSDLLNVSTIRLRSHLGIGYWKFDTRLDLNEVSDARLPTPALAIRQSVYYERALFKKSMPAQFGFNVYYQSEFEAMAYQPATRQFHLAPGNNIGAYPVVDVFFAGKVGGFKLFAILQHLNEGLSGDAYYKAANYPMMPFSIRFGLEWRLFD
jgi:hypothetical protein